MAYRPSARLYAQAVFQIAQERDQLDNWAEDLGLMSQALQNEEFSDFLEHAKVPPESKARAIAEVLQGTDPLVQNFLSLLVSRGLAELGRQVEQEYQKLLDGLRGREHVEVYSAVPLDPQEGERIASFLRDLVQKEVVLDTQLDPSILGGLVFRVGDKLLDGSTRTRLQELRKQMHRDTAGPAPAGMTGR